MAKVVLPFVFSGSGVFYTPLTPIGQITLAGVILLSYIASAITTPAIMGRPRILSKPRRFTVIMDEESYQLVVRISSEEKRSASEILRELIRSYAKKPDLQPSTP